MMSLLPLSYFHLFLGEEILSCFVFHLLRSHQWNSMGLALFSKAIVQQNASMCLLEVGIRQLLAWVGFKPYLKCFLEHQVICSLWISKCFPPTPGPTPITSWIWIKSKAISTSVWHPWFVPRSARPNSTIVKCSKVWKKKRAPQGNQTLILLDTLWMKRSS